MPLYNPATASGGGLFSAYALLRDEKTSGTAGGTFNSGAWRTRDLNTEVFDPAGIVSLSSNQFTLAAGTYFIEAYACAYAVDRNKLKLANITDATDVFFGNSNFLSSVGNYYTPAFVAGRVTITGTKVFELQHRCETTGVTNGFGVATSLAVEVYAQVEIWKETG